MSIPVKSREVFSRLEISVSEASEVVLQVAVAQHPGARVSERLTATQDGEDVIATEVAGDHRGRIHLIHARPGQYVVEYEATITGRATPIEVTPIDALTYLRPSRYAESDRIWAVANEEFGSLAGAAQKLAGVSSWVGSQLSYVPGSSGPTDGAVDTLLLRQGVCRDYAHLCVALLRAMDVPARLVGVYAPGIDPMDFHAVAEAMVDGVWRVVDATLLGPRSSMVRLSTGRDAADTAFMSNYGGQVDLLGTEVRAVIDGELPGDDITELVSLG